MSYLHFSGHTKYPNRDRRCVWANEDTIQIFVRLVLEGMGVREVERNLDITFGVVKGWVQKQRVYELREDGIRTGKIASGG